MNSAPSPYDFLVAPLLVARGNVTSAVTDRLRRAIVTLELRPGEALDKNAICERLGVSRFPVSEALARLQTEGLVDILPQRGSTVSLVRLADVSENMLIRKALECEAARVLIGRADAREIDALGDNIAQQRSYMDADDRQAFHILDLEFHDLLFAHMPYARIKATVDAARANLDRARRLIITPRRLAFSVQEHQAILESIIARDTVGACTAIRAHIDTVTAEVFAYAGERPELFADESAADRNEFPAG